MSLPSLVASLMSLRHAHSKGQGRWWLWKELVLAVVLSGLAMGLECEGLFLQNAGYGEVTATKFLWQCTREAY